MFAMTSAYKLLQNEIFEPYNSSQQKNLIIQILLKPLIESLLCVLINRLKKSDSPVKLREKMLNFVVKYCENCMFCRAQVIIRGKTSHISWLHSTFLESSRQRRRSSAISWRQNNGKMAERDWSHMIAVLQRLKGLKKYRNFKTEKKLLNEACKDILCVHSLWLCILCWFFKSCRSGNASNFIFLVTIKPV